MIEYTAHQIIYSTTTDYIWGLTDLYKEWTGKDYDNGYLLFNSHFIVARCGKEGYDDVVVDGKSVGKEIVGAAQLIITSDPFWNRRWGLVENVFVKEEYRERGIGKGLMKAVEVQATLFGCEFIKLTTRKKEGKELYKSLGYEEALSFRKELQHTQPTQDEVIEYIARHKRERGSHNV